MKRIFALLCSLAPVALSATETLWVYGVSEYGGWYDADKTDRATDFNKCWAAVSSNLINWWQNQYDLPDKTPNLKVIPDEDAVWDKYRNSATNHMGDATIGIDWWWTGDVYSNFHEVLGFIKEENIWSAAYFTSNVNKDYAYNNYVYTHKAASSGLTDFLYKAMTDYDSQRLGLGINLGGSGGHGVTLWGAEFDVADDNARTLKALWITDSDDITESEDFDLKRFEVYEDGSYYYLKDYWSTTNKVESLTVLNAAATDTWKNMERIYLSAPVPEPATATLSLLALAGLAARRRRR